MVIRDNVIMVRVLVCLFVCERESSTLCSNRKNGTKIRLLYREDVQTHTPTHMGEFPETIKQ